MALDIIETKLFREPKEIIKKSITKYRCNLIFKSKAFGFINLPKILRLKEVCENLPSIRSTLFNYKQFVLHLNTDELLKDPNSI